MLWLGGGVTQCQVLVGGWSLWKEEVKPLDLLEKEAVLEPTGPGTQTPQAPL